MSQSGGVADAIPLAGEVLAGKYRIERELGRGGMGVVMAAHHQHLDEAVAIKFLLPELSQDPNLVSRFLREGRASIKIRSEHVVRVLDVATLPGGTPYMVMEYLDGTDLERLIERAGPLPVKTAVGYVLQAIEALAEAHALGLVHRDLKPANLFLVHRRDGSECIKVLDFGITKATNAEAGSSLGMTTTQGLVGSPRYMSPEQMRPTRAIDVRADIWALGVVLHELLVGTTPFGGSTMTELLATILQDPAPPLRRIRPEVPAELERVVLCCLEKDPSNRPQNVAELARSLASFGPVEAGASAERVSRVLKVGAGASSPTQANGLALAPAHASAEARPAASHTSAEVATLAASTSPAWTPAEAQPSKSRKTLALAGAIGALALVGGSIAVIAAMQHSKEPTASTAIPVSAAMAPPAPSMAASTEAAGGVVPSVTPAAAPEPVASLDPLAAPTLASSADPRPAVGAPPRAHLRVPGPSPAPSVRPSTAATTKPGNDLFDGRK
jgi:serine/threonine-protein kinase